MNSFGHLLRLTSFGESHGPAIGGVLDGFPAGIELDLEAVQRQLDRRRPGQSPLVSQRRETDVLEVLSGIHLGRTTGAPIGLILRNADARPADYDHLYGVFRPGHADYTWWAKYAHRDPRGGGRNSARETAVRVAAGAMAQQLLKLWAQVEVRSWVQQVHDIIMPEPPCWPTPEEVDHSPVRCPHPPTALAMAERIAEVRKQGDTLGGVIQGVAVGLPAGWGEPVFAKLHAQLGLALLGINACKGFEVGSGFAGTLLTGSQHNDAMRPDAESATGIGFAGNHAGGVLGGISTGQDLVFRAAFKPVSTLLRPQNSVNEQAEPVIVEGRGRHDPCVLPRAVPVVDAMVALVLADAMLQHNARKAH